MRNFIVVLGVGFMLVVSAALFAQSPITAVRPPCGENTPSQLLVSPYFTRPSNGWFHDNRDNLPIIPIPGSIEAIKITNAKDIDSFLRMADSYIENGQYEEARKIAFKVLDNDFDNEHALFSIAYSYDKEGNLTKALECYQKAEKTNTFMNNLHTNLGWVYWRIDKGNAAKARKEYELEMEYNPKNWLPYINRAAIYRYNKDDEKAYQDYAKAVEIGGDDIGPLLVIARFCEQIQVHVEEGKRFLERVLELYPMSWRAWEIKAGFHYHNKEYKEAEKCYLHSLGLKRRAITLYELCWTYVKMNRLEPARKTYEEAYSMGPLDDDCYQQTAKELLEEKGVIVS